MGRAPMAQPPGSETRARPYRASSGPEHQHRGAHRLHQVVGRLGEHVGGACTRTTCRSAPGCPCPAAAPSGPAPSTSTSRGSRRWARRSPSTEGYVEARARRLKGGTVSFDMITVTGTENVLMAAALAEGTHRAGELRPRAGGRGARPGAQQDGRAHPRRRAPTSITIEGVDRARPVEHRHPPTASRPGTLLVAAAITGGDVLVQRRHPRAPRRGACSSCARPAARWCAEADGLRCQGPDVPRAGGHQDHASTRASPPTCRPSSWP